MEYSLDFRKKVLAYCAKPGHISETADLFQMSRNTIYQWQKLKEKTGDLHHQAKGSKPRKVDRDNLKADLETHPDAYLTGIASEFGCHPTAIHYALKAMRYTRKKSCTCYEQDPEKVDLFLKVFNHLSHLTPVILTRQGLRPIFIENRLAP